MNYNYQKLTVLVLLLLANGCASAPSIPVASTDARPCARNFTVNGSSISFSGKEYSTNMFIAGVSSKVAIDRASKQIALDGMTITTLDREGGLIAAANKTIAGKGDTVPLITTIESQKDGVQILMKYSTGFGVVTPEDAIRDFFCKVISAVEKK